MGDVCVCVAADEFRIQCYGEDFLMVNNLQLDCVSKVEQACYTRGEPSSLTPLLALMCFASSCVVSAPRLSELVFFRVCGS